MNSLLRMRSRARRLPVVLGAVLIYVVLLIADGTHSHFISSSLYLWLTFGFSAFVSLIFLSVGSFVWLYARDRNVAALLFASCCASMLPFVVETAAISGDPFFAMVSGTGSILAFILYSLLSLAFPINFLSLVFSADARRDRIIHTIRIRRPAFLLGNYLVVLLLLGSISLTFPITRFLTRTEHLWLSTICLIFVVFAIIGIVGTVTLSYNASVSVRQKQQLFLFVLSVPLAFVPFLMLTAVPQLLRLPSQFVIDPRISTLSMVLMPLAMGYAVLRYQVMVLDTYIRRAAIWIVGTVFLALSSYLIIALYTFLFAGQMTLYVLSVAATSVILAPFVWWLAKVLTGRLFFNEMLHYHRLLEQPFASIDKTLSLDEAANLLTLATERAFETSRVTLFVLDEGSGYYHVRPALVDGSTDENRRELLCTMLRLLGLPDSEHIDALEQHSPFITQVAASHRPLLLSEVGADRRVGQPNKKRLLIARADRAGDHLLLAPVRVQGKMIGVLLLGEHSDFPRQYAGPDFEAIQLILSRFSPVLETTRLYEHANQQAILLNGLYGNVPAEAFRSTNEVADAYAVLAADTALVRAEIWLDEMQNAILQCVSIAGSGPHLVHAQTLQLGEQDWLPCFSSGYSDNDSPGHTSYELELSCLSERPSCPFTWLPLVRGDRRLGVIVLTYPRPHRFFKEETKVLLMFAQQCTAALLNVAMTMELRSAYERQKELDRLKDQFIITASHELRTPLTAVQGYIELLNEYNTTLSEEARANFIAKAHRGCDELTLMVGNIMDASRVQIDAENVRVIPISLRGSIQHVLEILEAIIRREQRAVCVNVPDMLVLADDIRLRQVLLNLVSNALKYSSAGTRIEISAQVFANQLTVRVRDYGPGILPKDQSRLFDRFMRLDRDMNSPVRGAGLGLYICKQLVEAMGGDIWVESQGIAGEGSTFAFNLACADNVSSTRPLSLHNSDLSVL
jgi:signal transduction histidine kinase